MTPSETRAGSAVSANGDLVNRVQQLRLNDQLGAAKRGGGSWLPWILCGLLALTWAGVGARWYKNAGTKTDDAPAGAAAAARPAGGGPAPAAQPGGPAAPAAAPGEVLLRLKGNIIPALQIAVSPIDVSGEVIEVSFAEGKAVKKGEVLARLRDTRYLNELKIAEKSRAAAEHRLAALMPAAVRESEKMERAAKVARAKANLARANQELGRQKGLMSRGNGSQQDLDRAQADADAMKAELELEEAMVMQLRENSRQTQIDAAQADLDVALAREEEANRLRKNCTITAPIDGIVLTKKADVGSLVSPMSFNVAASMCEIANLANLEIEMDVPERQITKVRPGLECQITADADPTRSYTGVLDRVMPIADDSKNVIKVRVRVILPPGEVPGSFLKPKMAVDTIVYNRDFVAEKK